MEDGEDEEEESLPTPRVDLPVPTCAEEAERLRPRQQEDQAIGWGEKTWRDLVPRVVLSGGKSA